MQTGWATTGERHRATTTRAVLGALGVLVGLAWLMGPAPAHAGVVMPNLNVANASPLSVAEGNVGPHNVTFAVTLSATPPAAVHVSYATMYGSATAGSDYDYKESFLDFASGASGAALTQQITVVVNGDLVPENDENFFVQLYGESGATLGNRFGQAVIANDDAAPVQLSVSDGLPAPVTEGSSGTTPVSFDIVLSASPAGPVTYKYATNYGSAVANVDYVYKEGTGTFASGASGAALTQQVTVLVNGDGAPEGNETFFLQLYDVGGATVTDAYGLATIQNDDVAVPTISIADRTGTEGTNLLIPVTLSISPSTAVSVKYTTMPGTYYDTNATPGTDFTAQAGTLTWASGASGAALTQNVSVPLLVDPDTGSEHFYVQIYDPLGGNLAAIRYGMGTISAPPVANADTYSAVGNTKLAVGVSVVGEPVKSVAGSVLTNDTDPETGPADTLTVTVATNVAHGTLTLNADGTFTYLPAVGYTGPDGFTYNLSDGQGNTVVGTVTISVATLVWYVNNSLAPAGDGRSTSPFNSLTPINAAGGGGDQDFIGDVIFLYQGGGNYTGGLPLENNQRLVGQPEGLVVGADTLLAAGGSNPTITNAAGAGITLANDNVTRRVNVSGTSGAGITGTGVTNADIGSSATVSSSTGSAFSLSGNASGTIDFRASITHSASGARSVSIANRTGGTVSVAGSVSDTGGGISLASNTGATISFIGGVTVSSGANAAFSATGGGTVAVTGAANTLATTTGTALNVASTTIGASGLTFRSIASNGAVNGILLTSTGSSGGLTVTGTGSAGTGGTIQGSSNSGVETNGTTNLNLSWMSILNNGNAVTEDGLRLVNVFGTGQLTSSTVTGSFEDNVYLSNNSGTLTSFSIQGPSCSIGNNNTTLGNAGVSVLATLTSTMNVTINNCAFSGNRSDTIHTDTADSSNLTATITNNVITAGTGGANQGNIGIDVTTALTSTLTYDVENNKIGTDGVTNAPLLNHGLNVFAGNNSTATGKVINNTIRMAGATFSGTGIRLFQQDSGTLNSKVDGNTVSNVGLDFGIDATDNGSSAGASTGKLNVAVTNNNVSVLSAAINSIHVRGRRDTVTCARYSGNTATTNGGGNAVHLSQANTATVRFEIVPPPPLGALTDAQAQAELASLNPAATSAEAFSAGGTGITGVAAGTCTSIPA